MFHPLPSTSSHTCTLDPGASFNEGGARDTAATRIDAPDVDVRAADQGIKEVQISAAR